MHNCKRFIRKVIKLIQLHVKDKAVSKRFLHVNGVLVLNLFLALYM